MNITEARTVGEIAVEYTGSIPLFENWKIDFCCGGKKSLKEACEQKGLPLQEVLGTLQRKAAERMDVSFATFRRYLKAAIERLTEALWQREISSERK